MSSAIATANSRVPGVLGILLIAFVIGKAFDLGPVGDWSWWVVLIPLWIVLGLWALFLLLAFIAFVSFVIVDHRKTKKRQAARAARRP